MEPLKIMTVSLEALSKHKALALYDGDKLAVTHCLPIQGSPSTWRGSLIQEIETLSEAGYAVLIEDRTETIARFGTKFLFDEIEDGRSNLYHALDWYFAMQNMGSIIADPSVERFMVRTGSEGAAIERKQDEKGRVVYDVNWLGLTGGHKAVLMCVVAAMMEPLSERYLRSMYDLSGGQGEKDVYDPKRVFKAITQDYDRDRFMAFEQLVIDKG